MSEDELLKNGPISYYKQVQSRNKNFLPHLHYLPLKYLIFNYGRKSKERKGFYGKVKKQWGGIRRLMIKGFLSSLSSVGLGLE